MALRRAFFVWQFLAAAVLPVWLLAGYALRSSSVSGLLGVVLLVPLVLVVELGLSLLLSARTAVRRSRASDAPAIAVLSAFQIGVVGFGTFGAASAWFGVLAVAAAIGGTWLGGRLLLADVRARVAAATGYRPAARTPIDAGEYVVLKPGTR